MMNNCAFVGRLASDPVIKEVNSTHLVNFTLAIEEHRRDKDGEIERKKGTQSAFQKISEKTGST